MKLLRLLSLLLALLAISATSAQAAGGAINGEPSVRAALRAAQAYWGASVCGAYVTPHAFRDKSLLGDAVVGGRRIRVARAFLRDYPAGPARTEAMRAVIVHEYGHLLGRMHETYADDPLRVMAHGGEGWMVMVPLGRIASPRATPASC
jgi:hypothetical protein